MKLKMEGGYLEVKELYMGAHMVNSPIFSGMDKNRDRRLYTFFFLRNFIIVTLNDAMMI